MTYTEAMDILGFQRLPRPSLAINQHYIRLTRRIIDTLDASDRWPAQAPLASRRSFSL